MLVATAAFAQKDSLSFLALGDSYTVGTSEIYRYCWPVQLKERLAKKKVLLNNPKIIAGAGWTTKKLLEQLAIEKPAPTYDLVSLLIGVNNQYRNQSVTDFQEDFIVLLNKSIALAKNDKSRVFVLSIPDWSVTPFARSKNRAKIVQELKAYNAVIKKETEERKMLFIDITKASREALFDHNLIAKDSLHPSRKMYKVWVKKISKKLDKLLD
ncbi:MAG: SGNH/GDSL hydrolase family protein [Maribacter sp.]|uniref:SGNH/GDSL hydrolase family protein n=1 Tax=Maribacter sp. TaxID=1897614 RepID=UPI0032989362